MKVVRTVIEMLEGECSSEEWLDVFRRFSPEWELTRRHPLDETRTDLFAVDRNRYVFRATREIQVSKHDSLGELLE